MTVRNAETTQSAPIPRARSGDHPPARSHGDLGAESDEVLLARIRDNDGSSDVRSTAREVLVERYHKLVISCVRPYRNSPENVDDLMQVGYVGLLKAINNYDPVAGDSLSAYALPCVSGEIKRHFRDRRWQIRVRRSAQELMLELRKVRDEFTQQFGRSPTEQELVRRLGVDVDEVREAQQADFVFTTYSLEAPLPARERPAQLADLFGEPDAGIDHTLDMHAVRAHWNELQEREQRVLIMRFYGNLTQTEIGERLGISQVHVSRLLGRALTRLRNRLTGEGARAMHGGRRPVEDLAADATGGDGAGRAVGGRDAADSTGAHGNLVDALAESGVSETVVLADRQDMTLG